MRFYSSKENPILLTHNWKVWSNLILNLQLSSTLKYNMKKKKKEIGLICKGILHTFSDYFKITLGL